MLGRRLVSPPEEGPLLGGQVDRPGRLPGPVPPTGVEQARPNRHLVGVSAGSYAGAVVHALTWRVQGLLLTTAWTSATTMQAVEVIGTVPRSSGSVTLESQLRFQ